VARPGEDMHWILCLSGDRRTATQLRQILRDLRFKAEMASGIQEALTLVQRSSPSLVVADFQLADGSGLEMIRHLRMSKRAARTPILMLATAMQVEHYRHKLVWFGPQEWLDKPVDDERLAAAVTRWVGVEVEPPPAMDEPLLDKTLALADQGSFAQLPFARVLVLAGRREPGRLRVARHDQWIDIWLDREKIVALSSSFIQDNTLGQLLVRKGRMSIYDLQQAQTAIEGGRRLGQWAIEQGLMTEEELTRELQQQVMEKITSAFSWQWYDGDWSFQSGTSVREAHVLCDIPVKQVILTGITRHYDRERLEMIFSKRERLRRAIIPTSPFFDDLPVTARRLLAAADGRASAVRVRRRSGMEVLRFYQTLYALWVIDMIRFGDPVTPEEDREALEEEPFLEAGENIEFPRR